MSARGIPDRVRRFVSAHIHSVEEMDILLLLREHRDRDWSADEVAKELRSAPHSASNWLAYLSSRGLLAEEAGPDPRYRYAPGSTELSRSVDELADTYARRKVSVISLIYSKPSDQVQTFADAFRFRRDEPD